MKQMSSQLCKLVSAGLVLGNHQCVVSSVGIPSNNYVYLEIATQNMIDDIWTEQQTLDYLNRNGSMQYFDQYRANFKTASWL